MQKKLTLDTTVALKSENRSGSNYLNALLFARYRRQLWKSCGPVCCGLLDLAVGF